MNTRTNNSSIVRNVMAVIAAAMVMASPVMAADSGKAGGRDTGKPVEGGTRAAIADFNHDGKIDSIDLFEFYTAWYYGKASGDIDGNGVLDAYDVWMYLDIWMSSFGPGTVSGTSK